MDEKELVQWMRVVDQRLTRLEVQGDATPGAPDLPMTKPPPPQGPPQVKYIPADYEGRGPDTIPAPPVTMTWQKVAGAFAKRYEKKRGLAWHYGPHVQHLEDVAEWIDRQDGSGPTVAKRLLDHWFGLEWAQRVDYKPKFLAENLGSVYAPPVVKREDEPDADAINARRLKERRKQEMDELAKKLARDLDEAVPPPGSIEDMLSKIGRKL